MKRIFILVAGGLALACSGATARSLSQVRILDSEVMRNGDQLTVAMAVDYNPVELRHQEQLIVTPLIVKGMDTMSLEPMVFTGSTARMAEKRMVNLYGEDAARAMQPYETVVLSKREMREQKRRMNKANMQVNKVDNVLLYRKSMAYQPWMTGSTLMLKQDYYACNDMIAQDFSNVAPVAQPVNAMVMIITPEYEIPERGTRDLTAHVNFEVDKSQVRRNFMNNAHELDRIYSFTNEVIEDNDLDIEKIHIKGYASPEASYSYNDRLASSRVNALQKNLEERFNLSSDMFTVEHVAEDWDSLRSWISESDLQYRAQLLDIIDDTPDPDARDAKIRALDNSVTYNKLLSEVYPELRRVDYSIDYKVAPFTAERGRDMMRNSPSEMTLAQYYFVADSYDAQSPEWLEAYTVAAKHFPEDPVCSNNVAAMAIAKGDHATAKKHLERVKNDPRCLNNLGIVYLREGNTQEAEKLFRTAAKEGSSEAEFNLANLQVLR